MRLEGGDHERVGPVVLTGQVQQPPGKDAFLAPPLPAVAQSPVRTIGIRRILPAQASAIEQDNPAQPPPVVDAGPAVGRRHRGGSENDPGDRFPDTGFKTRPPRLRQPKKIGQGHRAAFEPWTTTSARNQGSLIPDK